MNIDFNFECLFGRAIWTSIAVFAPLALFNSSLCCLPPQWVIRLQRAAPMIAVAWVVGMASTDLKSWICGEEGFHCHAQYLSALCVSFAFGVGFSLDAVRTKDKTAKAIGAITGLVFLLAIANALLEMLAARY